MKPQTNSMQSQSMLDTLCPICHKNIFLLGDYPGWDGLNGSLQFREIGECIDCQLGIGLPAFNQDTLDLFYKSGEFWGLMGGSLAQVAHERTQSKRRVLFCHSHLVENAKVLDIGAGHGWIANAMNELKLDISGYDFIEPDSSNSELILSRSLSFPIRKIFRIEDAKTHYDLIFLNHIIEHVSDPLIFLKNVLDKLKPGGVIYIECPNMDNLFKKSVFPHTLFFSKRSLDCLTKKLGLTVLELNSFGNIKAMHGTLGYKILHLLFNKASRNSIQLLENFLDNLIWKYDRSTEDGIWIRLLARKETG